MADLLKIPIKNLIFSHYREQDLYEPKITEINDTLILSKHHTLATNPNIELFVKYQIKPIILIRNIPDVIISLRDHIAKTLIWPHFFVPKDFGEWENAKQYDFLIDLATPWYIFFYVSWTKAIQDKILVAKMINYNDFNTNSPQVIKETLEFYGFNFNLSSIEQSINNIKKMPRNLNRINKGEINRGQNLLSNLQIEKIKAYTKHYHDIDFSPIL
nr:hypothetical protein [Luteirhabdus pelagi]